VTRTAGSGIHRQRIRALIVILWRAGLRVDEVLSLAETDLEHRAARSGALRQGRQAPRGRDGRVGWEQIETRRRHRPTLPIGPFLCVLNGPTRGRAWSQTGVRAELRRLAVVAGMRRRFAPHQLHHAYAVEMAREGVPLPVIQRQLGYAHLGVSSTCLEDIDTTETIRHDPRQTRADDPRKRRPARPGIRTTSVDGTPNQSASRRRPRSIPGCNVRLARGMR